MEVSISDSEDCSVSFFLGYIIHESCTSRFGCLRDDGRIKDGRDNRSVP